MITNEGAIGDFIKKHIVNYSAVAKEGGKKWAGVKDNAARKGRASRAKFAKREHRIMGEVTLTELNKKTLGNYIKKATKDISIRQAKAPHEMGFASYPYKNTVVTTKKVKSRMAGVDKAVNRLTETAPPGMEDWIKKRKASFQKRYGDRWQEVLYATAWKRHGKNEELTEGIVSTLRKIIANRAKRKVDVKTKKQQINQLQNHQGIKEETTPTINEIISNSGKYISPRYRMYQYPDKSVDVHRREMDLRGTKSIGRAKDVDAAKHMAKADFAKDFKSFPGKLKVKKGTKFKIFEGKKDE